MDDTDTIELADPIDMVGTVAEGLGGIKSLALPIVRKSCRACRFSDMEGKDRVCRLNPPHLSFIPVPTQQIVNTPQGPRPMPAMEVRAFTGFPIVQHDQFCWQFSYKGHGG